MQFFLNQYDIRILKKALSVVSFHLNILKRILITFSLSFYRLLLAPQLNGSCRFYPSCSRYAEEAYLTFPASKATWLTLVRICRCHPFGKFGYDPLPKHKEQAK